MQPNNQRPGSDLSSMIFPERHKQEPQAPKPVGTNPGFSGSSIPAENVPPQQPVETNQVPISNQPPVAFQPPQAGQPPVAFQPGIRPAKKFSWALIIVILVIVLGGGLSYAFYKGYGPFGNPPYDTTKLASSIFDGITKVRTASYSLNVNIASLPKEAGVQPFSVAVPTDPKKLEAYGRDQDKVRDISDILRKLSDYNYKHKTYPSSLTTLGLSFSLTGKGYQYSATKSGTDFSLIFTVETAEVYDSINSSALRSGTIKDKTPSSGKTITFTKDSSTYIYLPTEPTQPGIFNLLNMGSSLGLIPGNFKFDGTLSGAAERVDDKNVNSDLGITAVTDFSDMHIELDAGFKKIGSDMYVIVRKMPSMFFDISKLKDKWIKISASDLANYGSLFSSQVDSTEGVDALKEKSREQANLFLTIADRDQALVVKGSPVKESVHGYSAYRYNLEFNKDTLAKFYTDLTTEFKAKYADKSPIPFDQATADYLASPEFDKVFQYLRDNTELTLWADSSGIPLQLRYSIRIVPDSKTKPSDNEIKLALTFSLDKINKSITVDVPSSSMSLEDATIALTGQSKEQYKFQKQMSNISTIRYALENYKSEKKTYPASLALLTTTKSSYGSSMILKAVPTDVYDNVDYSYVLKGSDFALSYQVELPKYVAGNSVSGIYDYDYSSSVRKVFLKAISGTNTATSKYTSEQARLASAKDTDGDGLPDILEQYIGTNISKKDSDGDSYSDYDEVMGSSNPLGPGKLKSSGLGY
ncbi:MAG: hypothetical protein WCT02_01890 [Candidatus Paceibacterota bacterium]